MDCTKCGASTAADAAYCSRCGAAVAGRVLPPEPPRPSAALWSAAARQPSSDRRPRPWILLVAIVGGAIFTGAFLYSGGLGRAGARESATACTAVAPAVLTSIASGLTVSGGGTLRDGQAVRSGDFRNVWFVAAEIDGPGLERDGDVGVWALNSLEPGGGLILSVDATARAFSDWPDGSKTSAAVSMANSGASAAEACAWR